MTNLSGSAGTIFNNENIMTYPESEFYDCKTLALMYDSDRDVIKRTVHELKDKGHVIEILYWGKQGKMKVHGKQFRRALLREYGEGGMNK